MPVSRFYKYATFRLLVPFAIGILWGNYAYFEGLLLPPVLLWAVIPVSLFILVVSYRGFSPYPSRWVFGLCACLSFLFLGAGWQNVRLQQTVAGFPSAETVYRVVVTDRPEAKENSVLCRVRILEQRDSSSVKSMDSPSVLVYFSPDSAAGMIRRGNELLLSAKLALPEPGGNPDEFDYPRYLMHQGISGTGFVSSGRWQVVAHRSHKSIQDYAYDCRDKVLDLYRGLGFTGDNFAVLSALTVGYNAELSESIYESFSVSGASHVLSLSGLHIGFLYVLLFFLLKKIPGTSVGMKAFRVATVVVLLWGFAFLTGLSSPVVRSVLMFSLIGFSQFSTGRAVSINTLFVAAFAMLVYNPFWLYDVGFQLSFVAVASILFIQPWLHRQITVRNRLLDKLWGIVTVSVAAQIGAAPLVLLYFSRFSVHFLLTNILVVPLTTVIIYVAIVLLLLSFFPPVGQLVAYGLNLLLDWLNAIVRSVEQLPFASVDGVWVYQAEVVLFYAVLFLLGWYVVRRRSRYLLATLSVLLLLFVHRVYRVAADSPRQSLVFYHVRHCPAVHCILPDGRSWLVYADSLPDERRLTRAASGYWNRLRLAKPVPVVADYSGDCLIRRDNVILFGGKSVCIVHDDRWKNKEAGVCLPVDYLYLCKGYTGKIAELRSVFHIRQVVLDSSISGYRRDLLREECERLELPLISLPDRSSYFSFSWV